VKDLDARSWPYAGGTVVLGNVPLAASSPLIQFYGLFRAILRGKPGKLGLLLVALETWIKGIIYLPALFIRGPPSYKLALTTYFWVIVVLATFIFPQIGLFATVIIALAALLMPTARTISQVTDWRLPETLLSGFTFERLNKHEAAHCQGLGENAALDAQYVEVNSGVQVDIKKSFAADKEFRAEQITTEKDLSSLVSSKHSVLVDAAKQGNLELFGSETEDVLNILRT